MPLGTGKVVFAETKEFQSKVLANMLADPPFCDVAANALTVEDFSDKILQWFFTRLSESKVPLTEVTLQEELLKDSAAKIIDADITLQYIKVFNEVKNAPVTSEVDYIKDHLLNFIRRQACVRAVLEAPNLLKEDNFPEIERLIVEAANAGADIMDSGLDYFGEHEDRINKRAVREKERKLSTGIPELDNLTYGGIKTKQLGLVVGGTGRGKSLFLQWLAKVAILLGKRVVYYTFELSDEDMADRFDSLFAHIKPGDLQDHTSEALRKLSVYNERFGSSLFIKEYPEDDATVDDLKAHLMQLTAQGFKPDLVLVDYVDLIKPHRTYGDLTQEQTTVIKKLRGVAKGLDTRMWTACQLNRGGMGMETPDESAIAGGVSRLFTCDIAIFMAQTGDEREDQYMRLIIQKNRNGKAGRTIKLDTEYDFMTFYRDPPPDTTEQLNDTFKEDDDGIIVP